MAEQDKQVGPDKPTRRPDILRAKDIIPTRSRPASENENVNPVDIPRFNLANDIMAQQRRITAFRRKGPGSEDRGQRTEDNQSVISPQPSIISFPASSQSYTSRWDPIIADIVARDIKRLCGYG